MQRPLKTHLVKIAAVVFLAATPCAAAIAAGPSSVAKPTDSAGLYSSKLKYDKKAAHRLRKHVAALDTYKELRRKLSKRDQVAATKLLKALSRFYAVPASDRGRVWNQMLTRLVEQKKLTAKDKRVLSKLLIKPKATLAAWRPGTRFGRAVLAEIMDDDSPGASGQSASGDGGVLIGATVGAIAAGWSGGGVIVGIGVGAALGKLVGEVVDAFSKGNSGASGPSSGGDEGGDEGGDGGGDGGDGGDGGGDGDGGQ